ncbi:hypothetical protein ACIQB5_27795 [Streptomyces sp. NPDC088560]|uniref:hypothetical protein n=1 Tax=Streptomyces sp. NPDC088560 TaxID=3365868 RepID=UPI00380D52BC
MPNATGLLLWSVAAAAGLSAVLLAGPRACAAIRIVGEVVLVAPGIRTLWSVRRSATGSGISGSPAAEAAATGGTGFRGGFATGLGTSLGNPKAGCSRSRCCLGPSRRAARAARPGGWRSPPECDAAPG